jgi:hypothetical protein
MHGNNEIDFYVNDCLYLIIVMAHSKKDLSMKFFFIGLIVWMAACSALAEQAQMVERHIFTPETAADSKEELPALPAVTSSTLEKEISFTGVVISPKGKLAMIAEGTKNEKKKKQFLKVGDQIKGMTLKEIEPNHVLIASKDSTIRLNLYRGGKTRPTAPPETGRSATENPANAMPPGLTADAQKAKMTPEGTPPIPAPDVAEEKEPTPAPGSPFGGGGSGAPPSANPNTEPTGSNPFRDILRGAERKQSAPGKTPFSLPGQPTQ